MKRASYVGLVSLFAVSALVLYLLLSNGAVIFPVVPNTPIPTQTSTATPPADMGFEAVVTTNADCLDWSNKILANIEAYDQVRVLGRNRDGVWYMVRWPRLIVACWVESNRLKPSNFRPEELLVIPETFPPVFTPTASSTDTFTPTITPTDTPTIFYWPITSVYTPTKTPKVRKSTSTPTSTATFDDPSTSTNTSTSTYTPTYTFTSTDTPTVTLTRTSTSTFSPTPTRTPTITPTFTPTPCIRPSAPTLVLTQSGQSKNIDLTWKPVGGASDYELFQSKNGESYLSLGRTKKTSMNNRIEDKGTYEYYVVAINSCGSSEPSNIEIAKR